MSNDRLKELLRNRLIECGWRDELKQYCKGWSPCLESAEIRQISLVIITALHYSPLKFIAYNYSEYVEF